MSFQIGDVVKCIDHPRHLGAIAEIVGEDFSDGEHRLHVRFLEHPNSGYAGDTYELFAYRFTLHKRLSSQEKVCVKIKLMESRWKEFQQRKHHV